MSQQTVSAAPRLTLPPPDSATYFPALTGIRAVAAYLVCLHHFNPFPNEGQTLLLHRLVMEFHIGVPIFFVLSGFLITQRYYGTEQWTRRWWAGYLRNRFARIYPLYFLLTTLTFWMFQNQPGVDGSWRTWLLNVLFLRGFLDELKYSGIAQGWTLTVEECFYLFAPVAFLLIRRRRVRLWAQPLLLLALGIGFVLLLHRIPLGLFANFKFMLLFTFFGRCFEFYAGMQLALWLRAGQLRVAPWPGLYTVLGLALMAATLGGMVAMQGSYDFGQEHPFGVVLNNVVLPGGILLFFAGLLAERTPLQWVLTTPPLQILGRSSYIFYLIHVGVVHDWLAGHITGSSAGLFLLLNALSVGLHYLVEQPLNQLIRSRPRPATSPTLSQA
ncbi:acyltransferase [Hymenobacter sp. BT175]|uniref:acyltransferase family protein n=1 Tax=Hymenobacter translucens TaxID=2886507 RepID=UPI001D0E9F03|nr:acyltransferase [Hymenobacter translucens]MCC2548658.1 acyltransferase [Hymenobacter translucens]